MSNISITSYNKRFNIKIEEIEEQNLPIITKYFKNIKLIEKFDHKITVLIEDLLEDYIVTLEENEEIIKKIKQAFKNYLSYPPSMRIGNRVFDFEKKVYIMAIINVTPDSFYDGGLYLDFEKAKKRLEQCYKEGAHIIDIGGESTRPGSLRISVEEELRRVIPLIKYASKEFDVPISVDTYKSKVAEEAIVCGASMINDISGLIADEKMFEVAKNYDVPIVIMHIRGNPSIMQKEPIIYEDVVSDVLRSLRTKIHYAKIMGLKEDKIIIDPGIGFGKSLDHNIALILRLNELKCLGRPILIGASRKSFIGKILNLPPEERLEGSLAILSIAIMNGANIARVHDVKESLRVAEICSYLRNKINRI
jgi:dihydropteroate synthase